MKVKILLEILRALNQDADIKTLVVNDYSETFITSNLQLTEYQDGSYLLDGEI